MSVDTSALYGWPSPDAIDSARTGVRTGGSSYLSSVNSAAATWQQLRGHYSGDGAEEMLQAFAGIVPTAEYLSQMAAQADEALAAFADGIRDLERERTALVAEVHANAARVAEALAAPDDPEAAARPDHSMFLRGSVAALAERYRALEEQTAAKLNTAAEPDHPAVVALLAHPTMGIALGTVSAGLETISSRVEQVYDPQWVYRRWPDRATRLQHMSRGRWEWQEWSSANLTRIELRPGVNEFMFEHLKWYENRVRADPGRWAPDAPAFGDLNGAARTAKVGGGILTVATAGVTIYDEREKAKQELRRTNPGMSEADLNRRANVEGAVRGGTKVGLDLAAGAAGAAIGTAVGGPVGMVIGAGIGIGISAVTDIEMDFLGGRTIKDAAADAAMDLVDGAADLWDSIFG